MKIAVVDYSAGNMANVLRMIRAVGYEASVLAAPPAQDDYDCVVLPGVGSFGWAMSNLQRTGMDRWISERYNQGKKIFGICLGLQLFMNESEETEGATGLGLIAGQVRKLKGSGQLRIPIVGQQPLSDGSGRFYFAHSYFVQPEQNEVVMAKCQIGQQTYPAMIKSKGFLGVQFHPELSAQEGKNLFNEFLGGRL